MRFKAITAGFLTLAALLGASAPSYGAEFSVISVIRTLPLKSDDPIVKDYYINAGTNNGLVNGATLDALRKMPVYDNINNKAGGDTTIPVAKLKLIYVDKQVAIGRLEKMMDRKANPIPGYDDVMVGDLIRVSDKQ